MKKIINLFIRYLVLVIVAIPNLYLFYFIFTPLTIYPVYFFLNLFFEVSLVGNTISSSLFSIEIVNACVAGSAYYLLLILNLSVPEIKIPKRIKMILSAFLILLIINVLRILLFTILLANNFTYFDLAHKFFWYFLSTIFVIAIWFAEVKLYKIKEIPFYNDLKFLHSKIKC